MAIVSDLWLILLLDFIIFFVFVGCESLFFFIVQIAIITRILMFEFMLLKHV